MPKDLNISDWIPVSSSRCACSERCDAAWSHNQTVAGDDESICIRTSVVPTGAGAARVFRVCSSADWVSFREFRIFSIFYIGHSHVSNEVLACFMWKRSNMEQKSISTVPNQQIKFLSSSRHCKHSICHWGQKKANFNCTSVVQICIFSPTVVGLRRFLVPPKRRSRQILGAKSKQSSFQLGAIKP